MAAKSPVNQVIAAAHDYIQRRWAPIPVPYRSKAPVLAGWPQLRLTVETIPTHFPRGGRSNIAVLNGQPSGQLVNVDLDSREAIALASAFLPPTPCRFGRKSKPESHWLYVIDQEIRSTKFQDEDGTMLAELLSTGTASVVPPSVHPSGEGVEWSALGEPARLKATDLLRDVKRLAVAALLARHWPAEGARHQTALAAAGFLLRARLDEEATTKIVVHAAHAAGDEEWERRATDVASTAAKFAAGDPITGAPTLAESLTGNGEKAVARLRQWLAADANTAEMDLARLLNAVTAHSDDPPLFVTPRQSISAALPRADTWPKVDPVVFQGLAGEFVELIDSYTEADPVALLGHFLAAFGSVIGSEPHARVGYDRHPGRLNIAFVGPTGKGRKGTALSPVRHVFSQIAPDWRLRIKTGLSSGEGLIYHVRDQREETRAVKKDDQITYEPVIVDPGESDKRLFVVEPEFAVVLKRMAGEGNTLSGVMRQAWDSGDLATLTKNSPVQATGAHISVIAHITEEELRRYLTETERANGFGNRFLWLLVRRSKMLPAGDPIPTDQLGSLIPDISAAVMLAQQVTEVRRTQLAAAKWAKVYPSLSEGESGLTGAILSRSEAQVLRLSTLYALLDGSKEVRVRHLKSALALWDYAEASARRIFGDRLGAPVADMILGALQSRGPMSETDIWALFARHRKAEDLHAALDFLEQKGRAQKRREKTSGRPAVIWEAK